MTTGPPSPHDGAARRPATPPTWLRAPALAGGVFAALGFAVLGVVFSRIDLALLAAPLLLAVTWAWDRRPDRSVPSTASAAVAGRPTGPQLDYTVSVRTPGHVDAVVLRLTALAGDSFEIVVDPPTASRVTGRIPLLHSGPQELLRVDVRLIGPDAATVTVPGEPLIVTRVIPPPYQAIRQLPLPRRLAGLTGTHDSTRAGDGGEFRDIHPFAPGDRLRRIDWKTTARRAQFASDLYVRRTAALADASVLIIMDSRDDIGEQVALWSRNVAAEKGISTLDIAREAASSIAAGYIHAGDRVGFQDLSSRSRMLAHRSGNRHLWRLLRAIETTTPSAIPFHRHRPPIVPPGALVFVLSSFLDDQPAALAAQWRGDGHRVIAVDVLPAPRFTAAGRAQRLAHRLVMMERNDRLQRLSSHGVELLRWPDDTGALPRQGRLRVVTRPRRRR